MRTYHDRSHAVGYDKLRVIGHHFAVVYQLVKVIKSFDNEDRYFVKCHYFEVEIFDKEV